MGAGVGLASLMHRVTWRAATTDDDAALTGTLVAKFAPTNPAARARRRAVRAQSVQQQRPRADI